MQGLVYRGAWNVALEETPDPPPPRGHDVAVRIRATGICGTDIGIVSGVYSAKQPVVLGHESSGDVVAVGESVTTVRPGDRVVIDPTYYCDACTACRTGNRNHCELKTRTETGVSRDGTFASSYVTEERFLYPLAPHVTYEEATLTEPLSCVMTGVNQLRLRVDMRAVVIGGGPIGMLYVHALALKGVGGVLVEIAPQRALLAEQLLPPRWQVRASLAEALASFPRAGETDLAVDTTGAMTEPCVAALARRGQLLTVGLRDATATINMLHVADRSLTILGSIDSLDTFAAAKHAIESGAIPARRMVTHAFSLAEYTAAFLSVGCDIRQKHRSSDVAALKTVIRPVG